MWCCLLKYLPKPICWADGWQHMLWCCPQKYLPKPICWADWWQHMQWHYLPSVGDCPARWGYLQCPLLWQSCRHHSHGCQGQPSGKQIGRKTKTLLSGHGHSMSYISWTLLTISACECVCMCMYARVCVCAGICECMCVHALLCTCTK